MKSVTPSQEKITHSNLLYLNFERGMTCRIYFFNKMPPYFARGVRDILNTNFTKRLVGRKAPLEWAPPSPDLTTCGFFLWDSIKCRVYATKPLNLSELIETIHTAYSKVREEMLRSAGETCVGRWLKVVESGGAQLTCETSETDGKPPKYNFSFLFFILNIWMNSVYCVIFRT